MVRFLCEKCRQEAAWVCIIGSQEVCLCRQCEDRESRDGAQGASPGIRRIAQVNPVADNGAPLLCGVCKDAPARVFSPSDTQVFCWRCEERSSGVGPRYLVHGNSISTKASSMVPSTTTGSQSSGTLEGFAGWPSDSDDSLLIEFSQGLAPNWTGESEFLSMNWSEGTGGILKTTSDVSESKGTDDLVEEKTNQELEGLQKRADALPNLSHSNMFGEVERPVMGFAAVRHQPIQSRKHFVVGVDGTSPAPLVTSLCSQSLPSSIQTIVPGVPYGMVPVTIPPAFTKRHQQQAQRVAKQPPATKLKRSKRRRRCTSMDDAHSMAALDESPDDEFDDEDDDEVRDDRVGSGLSGSSGLPQRRCTHCGASKTPQWRAGPFGQKTLCNACGVKYKAGRLSACTGPGGRSRKAGQIGSQRKVLMASQGRG
ncbi:hypothetical protein BSKO_06460 [Bryopsis sp. KO-2023]|nr:hypothetical protein BSKO_06460 [Bryopsis sp. KO-2023]